MIKIAIAGLACAGKTSVYKYLLSKDKRVKRIKFAQPHYDVLTILGEPKHREFLQEFSDLSKKHFGYDIFVKIYDRSVKTYNDEDVLVCEDMRYLIEYDYCRENGWYIIYVESLDVLRKKRSDALGLKWNPKHNSEQAHLFKHKCDITIVNNESIEELNKSIESIIPQILI